jgi:hydroxymethylpyrimidine pyrophosphatase-like HAD family hydrolase
VNRQIILLDLDGTLLTSKNIVSPLTLNIISACKKLGCLIGIVTGRPGSSNHLRLLKNVPYDCIAFYNGAKIFALTQLIESNALPYDQAVLIFENLENDYPGLPIDVYLEPWSYSNNINELLHMQSGISRKCSIYELPNFDVQRIRIKSCSSNSIKFQNYMTADSFYYFSVHGDAVITHKKACKGHVAERLADFLKFHYPI